MKRLLNRIFFPIVDYLSAIFSLFAAVLICGSVTDLFALETNIFLLIFVFPTAFTSFCYLFKGYQILWEFANFREFIRIPIAAAIASGLLFIVSMALSDYTQRAFSTLCCLIAFLFLLLISSFVRLIKVNKKEKNDVLKYGNVMIIGGGAAGNMIINDMIRNGTKKHNYIKCIIDDDPKKIGLSISGIKIVGDTSYIITAVKKYDIDLIVFAIPTCPHNQKSLILKMCQKTGCEVRVLPSYFKMLSSVNDTISSLREVQIEDLLGRDPIDIHVDSVLGYISDKTVIVTGGGGSIGSELCRQIAAHSPKQLIIFDIYENNAYDIQNELKREHPDLDLVVLIGSVRDEVRLDGIFSKYKPNIVFHAAAHKHVPLMEDSPNESMKNNVFGTYNTANIASKYGVERFVLISTDKAVNPTNIMGASKRICEMIVQYFNTKSNTEFVAVRFGNVLGSNGSVIPLFKKQIAEGGPVTVTDPNIIRYFMTIPEAVSLVLQAGASARGGEIFVLDMGDPVKIIDLAESLISLSGLKPYEDIQIKFTGLRLGEKLYEEKLLAEEGLKKTENDLIHIAKPIDFDVDLFNKTLSEIKVAMFNDNTDIRPLVKKIVSTYNY